MFSRDLKRLLGLSILACTLSCIRLSEEPYRFKCEDGECPSDMHCSKDTYRTYCIDDGLCFVNEDCGSGEACINAYGGAAPHACEKVECAEEFGDCQGYACNLPGRGLADILEYTCLTECTRLYRGDECAEAFVCDGEACVPRCNVDGDCDMRAGFGCANGSCTPGGATPCQSDSDCGYDERCSFSKSLCVAVDETSDDFSNNGSDNGLTSCTSSYECPPGQTCGVQYVCI